MGNLLAGFDVSRALLFLASVPDEDEVKNGLDLDFSALFAPLVSCGLSR